MSLLLICINGLFLSVGADYWSDRAEFIQADFSQAVGSSLVLTEKEKRVNEILMSYKYEEFDEGFIDNEKFLASKHFFHSKDKITESKVFRFLQKVPKGASLHSHDTALVSFEYLYNLTYKDDLYGCVVNNRLQLHFFGNNVNSDCDWKLIKDLRKENSTFDDFLKTQISIVVDNPEQQYTNIQVVWAAFIDTFITVEKLICYRPVFEEYFYHALKELYEDNILYLEFRGTLPTVYELDGSTYGPEQVVGIYIKTLNKFKKDYPEFHSARFIYAPTRNVDNKTADEYVAIAKKLKQLYPNFIAGFDLVGEEDKGKPLRDFIPQLLELSAMDMKFFFHAAETDWSGVSTDLNVIDAVLLNATRIGHGYGVVKHPRVLQAVKEKDIAIELNPISNQVLRLVDDLRNHPGNFLIAAGYPVVITCDDPSFWGAKALSYDWYMAFMGLSSREGDLRLLKRLALNSLKYSVIQDVEKICVKKKFQNQWTKFLDSILESSDIEASVNKDPKAHVRRI